MVNVEEMLHNRFRKSTRRQNAKDQSKVWNTNMLSRLTSVREMPNDSTGELGDVPSLNRIISFNEKF